MNDRPGSSFKESEVVDLYVHRPAYPAAVFEKLLELAPRHNAVLDIGCGPGKVSWPLTRSFAKVVAVDPSQRMIALGRSLPDGQALNLQWINSPAEEAPLGDWRFDLTVAAASIHWMDCDLLFPKLAAHAMPGHVFAAISGDDAFEPPWDAAWKRFLGVWVPEVTGVPYDDSLREAIWGGYRRHLDVGGSQYFSAPVEQSVEDFIKCQHSRDTWAYSRLGSRTRAFDAELAELLHDHAVDGQLTYTVRTLVTWGTIRSQ